MAPWFSFFLIGAAIVVGAVLLADAVSGFMRASSGLDEDAIGRRLSEAADPGSQQISIALPQRKTIHLKKIIVPFYSAFEKLLTQSDTALTMKVAAVILVILSLLSVVLFCLVLPTNFLLLSLPLGIGSAFALLLFYLLQVRASRVAKFEEQLPDAIDLIVRSLKVGHPLSAAVSIIAQEMPAPIGYEFTLADHKVSYGLSVPDAFREMRERVPLADLGYLIAAFQIQEESGGNLVESLAKLASVIRERFRMFRKIKAITAEGRMSAWLLSFFPIVTGFLITLVKPDYFNNVIAHPSFHLIVFVIVVMLILNIIVMLTITKIKV